MGGAVANPPPRVPAVVAVDDREFMSLELSRAGHAQLLLCRVSDLLPVTIIMASACDFSGPSRLESADTVGV